MEDRRSEIEAELSSELIQRDHLLKEYTELAQKSEELLLRIAKSKEKVDILVKKLAKNQE